MSENADRASRGTGNTLLLGLKKNDQSGRESVNVGGTAGEFPSLKSDMLLGFFAFWEG
jgi:hypothetical protein